MAEAVYRDALLAPYAVRQDESRGRRFHEPPPAYRGEYQRDCDRVIHSGAFRRLEYKTQVFVNHVGDMFRTRLTHSIEVARIARAVARTLHLNEDLTEAIALAHDLGHTPFGHSGQDALHACMKNYGGFEHNLQSLRVVDELEARYAEFRGLNLTFETREGILKHCSTDQARELGDVGERFLTGKQPSLEAQLANVADEIAYNNHDADDGLRSGLITLDQLQAVPLFQEQFDTVKRAHPDLHWRRISYEAIRHMINFQVTDLVESSSAQLVAHAPADLAAVRAQAAPLIGFSAAMRLQNVVLKRFLNQHLYQHYRVRRMAAKARRIVRDLFGIFMDEPRLLPPQYLAHVRVLEEERAESGRARAVADYIAGMTDRYAIGEYERVFNPSSLT